MSSQSTDKSRIGVLKICRDRLCLHLLFLSIILARIQFAFSVQIFLASLHLDKSQRTIVPFLREELLLLVVVGEVYVAELAACLQ